LIAQLTARSLTHDTTVVDFASPTWRTSFPSRVGTAMDALFARFSDAARVRDLLVPLAFAQGSGLPPGRLWAALAGALGTSAYAEQDVPVVADLVTGRRPIAGVAAPVCGLGEEVVAVLGTETPPGGAVIISIAVISALVRVPAGGAPPSTRRER